MPPVVQRVGLSQHDRAGDSRMAVWRPEPVLQFSGSDSQPPVRNVALPPEVRTCELPPGVGSADLPPVVQAADIPPVGHLETVHPVMPPDSVAISPASPRTIAFEDVSVSSTPMSPNRVRDMNSQDVPDEETGFEVSPDTSGILMRPLGSGVQLHVTGPPLAQAVGSYSDPVLGDPIAFAQCALIPGSDAPITLPVYTMPSGLSFMPGQSAVPTVASALSSLPAGWSSDMPRPADVSREGHWGEPLGDDGLAGIGLRRTIVHGPGSRGYESSVWYAASSSSFSGVYCGALVLFPGVLGPMLGGGGCFGSGCESSSGRRPYVIEPSDSSAVRYVDAENVDRDDDSRDRTCGVPF